jgi:hypothetical protein
MFCGGLVNAFVTSVPVAALVSTHRGDALLAVFGMVTLGVVLGVVGAIFLSKDEFTIPDRQMQYLLMGLWTAISLMWLVMPISTGQKLSLMHWAGFLCPIPLIASQLIPRGNRFRRVIAVTGLAGSVAWLSILVSTFLRWPAR